MTNSFPETKTGLRLGLAAAAVTGCLAVVLLAGLPLRAEDANPVLAKVNGRVFHIAFTERGKILWIISARKANQREQRRYEQG